MAFLAVRKKKKPTDGVLTFLYGYSLKLQLNPIDCKPHA